MIDRDVVYIMYSSLTVPVNRSVNRSHGGRYAGILYLEALDLLTITECMQQASLTDLTDVMSAILYTYRPGRFNSVDCAPPQPPLNMLSNKIK
jgi:hypothetical protein